MRVRAGGRHLGVSARVPTPTGVVNGATSGLAAIITFPILLLTLIVQVLTFVLWFIGWLFKAVWWLIVAVTAPLWAPIRGLHRRHIRKADHKAVTRVQRMKLTQPPTGPKVG